MTPDIQAIVELVGTFTPYALLVVLCLGFWRATAKQNATIRDLSDCLADMSRVQGEASNRWEALVDRIALRERQAGEERRGG